MFGIATFIDVMFFNVVYTPNNEIPASSPLVYAAEKQTSQNTNNNNIELSIPKLSINAKVQEVGITWKGNVAAPNNFSDAGWYKYGPFPGQSGTAIIDGHVDNGLGLPAVFSNLKNIQPGDNIYVKTSKDETLTFIVQDLNTYDYNSPTDNIFIKSDTPRLILITCAGSWVPELKTHNKRLVVTAILSK